MMTSNADQVAGELMARGVRAGAQAYAVTQFHGALLLSDVRARASLPRTGPPGPRLQTGNYVRSMNLRMQWIEGGPTASVGSNAPQGPRLEHGFYDTDSLGRSYEQPPYEHWGPALDHRGPLFQRDLAAIV